MAENEKSTEEILNSRYLLDFYIKDFKYISPEALVRERERTVKAWRYQTVGKVWVVQVIRGFKELFCQGSLHGMKYIFEPSFSRTERLTWVAIMIASVAACAGNITQLFLKWTSSPFVNVIDSLPSPVWSVPFPGVVLCPHLHVKLSYGNVSRLDDPDARFNRYEIERFRTWVMKIGGDIVGEDTMFIHKNRRVCHHFEEIYTLPNKRFTGLAIPTLHIPGVHVGPHPSASSGMSLNTGLRTDVPEKVGEQGDLPKQIAPSAVASTSKTFDEKEDTIKKAVTLRPVKPMMSKIERELRDVLAETKVALRKCCNSKNELKTIDCICKKCLQQQKVFSECSLEKFFASLVCPQMTKENRALDERLTRRQNDMLENFILQAAPKCSEMIKSCYWRSTSQTWMTEECCDKLFTPIFTNYGLCFAFNSLPLHGMTNATLPWQRSFFPSANHEALNWGLDRGYPKVFPPDLATKPFRVMASGEANGLGVELYLNNSEHQVACDGASVGFNIIISSPTNHVYTSTIIRLPMDRMTTIEVYPITYKTDSSLRALLPERRQCFFQNERELEYFEFYTDGNCKLDFLIREARSVCKCVFYNWPKKSPSEPICSTKIDFHCIDEVKAKVEEQLIYAYFADSEEQRKPTGASNSCHPACNEVIYNSQVFYSDLKTDPAESPQWGYPGPGEITRINVHFYDDSFLGQHRHAQYDDYYFIGAIGGLLSLFLGFSIISVAELIYFVLLRPLHAVLTEICHRHRK